MLRSNPSTQSDEAIADIKESTGSFEELVGDYVFWLEEQWAAPYAVMK